MWSAMNEPSQNEPFVANHTVLLVPLTFDVITLSDSEDDEKVIVYGHPVNDDVSRLEENRCQDSNELDTGNEACKVSLTERAGVDHGSWRSSSTEVHQRGQSNNELDGGRHADDAQAK
jgi:hypothetical protein